MNERRIGRLACPSGCGISVIALVAAIWLVGCGGTLADDCTVDSDCAASYECIECSIRNTCYYDDSVNSDWMHEYVCDKYGTGSPSGGGHTTSGGPGGAGGGGTHCGSNVWTCSYDDQVTPICQAACAYSGSERQQTCSILDEFGSHNRQCCTVC